MSWLDWVKRKLVGNSAPGKSGRVAESEVSEAGGGHDEVSTATLLAEGWALDAEGDWSGANEAFSKTIERNPNTSAYYGRGVVRCKLRHYPGAIADLSRALKLRPRFAAALTERGLAYVESGEIDRGIEDYDAAIAIDPSYGVAHDNKGAACLRLERWAEAVPHLDIALRLNPSHATTRYNRGLAHEMLGDFSRAIRDFQDSVRAAPSGPYAPHAAGRLSDLELRMGDIAKPEWPAPESLWTQIVAVSLEDTVADLLQRVYAEGAFVGMVELPDGGKTLVPIYGEDGIRRHLTEIADIIGPHILPLKLRQFESLFGEPSRRHPRPGKKNVKTLVEGGALHLVTHGERILGVLTEGFAYHDSHLPTVLFGERPIFERSESAGMARRCPSCSRDVTYFDAVIEDGKLADYSCPYCAASPAQAWVEERMRPGGWSRCGFLGETEVLRDVMARDAETLQRLGLSHAAVADALDRLLVEALRASEDRIARATEQFEEELRASGMRGVPGLALLPLGLSLDDLEQRLRDGGRIPAGRSTAVGDHDVFLQIYLGYQYCPFTRLRLPWSDDVPKMEVVQREVNGVVHHTAATDRCLPCRLEVSYCYGNLEFLIVHRGTRRILRGSGLLVHLIRDHHFFEGEGSPFRLDPERAVQVLGLSSP